MMIDVRTPDNELFNYTEAEELYNQCRADLKDDEFEKVIKRTQFYAFYIKKTAELIGCIYFFEKNRRLYVNAFANRGHHALNLECFKESLKWFKRNIYAIGLYKTSRLCLLKCGFTRIKDNLFVLKRSNKNGRKFKRKLGQHIKNDIRTDAAE